MGNMGGRGTKDKYGRQYQTMNARVHRYRSGLSWRFLFYYLTCIQVESNQFHASYDQEFRLWNGWLRTGLLGTRAGGGACLASRSSIRSDKDGKTLSRPLSSHLGVMIECLFHPPWRSYLIGPPSLICQCRARSAMQTVMTNHVLFISVDPLRFVRDPRFAFLVSFFFGGGEGFLPT